MHAIVASARWRHSTRASCRYNISGQMTFALSYMQIKFGVDSSGYTCGMENVARQISDVHEVLEHT